MLQCFVMREPQILTKMNGKCWEGIRIFQLKVIILIYMRTVAATQPFTIKLHLFMRQYLIKYSPIQNVTILTHAPT